MGLYLGSGDGYRKGVADVEIPPLVVPANARTHTSLRSLCEERLPHRENEGSRGMGPVFARTTTVLNLTPPLRNTRPECPFARAGDFLLRRTPPIAGRRSPRR